MVLPEDPEELRALFLRRARERDSAPEDTRDSGEPKTVPTKPSRGQGTKASQKPKPYRVIRLTVEEAKAIDEGRLTVEEVKALNVERDDDNPKVQRTTEAEAQGTRNTRCQTATGDTRGAEGQPSPRQESKSGTSSKWVHKTGPDETPSGAGEGSETRRVHHEDQTRPQQESSPNRSTGRVHETGLDGTPVGTGEVSGTGRVRGEDQTSPRQEIISDMRTGRVHETGPDKTLTGAGEVRESGRVHGEDQTSSRQGSSSGTSRDRST